MTSPIFSASSKISTRPAIALISEHGDPAAEIGKEEAGGQNVYVRQVGEALATLGWQVDMFTRKARPSDAAIVQHSPYCRTIRLVAGPESFVHRDELFQYMPQFVQAFLKFQNQNDASYPLIHTNYWMSGWVGLQLKTYSPIQLVHTYHSLGSVKYQTVENRPRIAQTRLTVERDILERSDCVVATSPQEQGQLRSLVSPNGKIEIIPCGTDINNFRVLPKPEARKVLGLYPNEQVLLYVGRFDPRKGIETLVRACALLKSGSNGFEPMSVRLVIVGGSDPKQADGQERQRIEQLVRDLGIAERTTFAGRVGHDRLPLYYAAAELCVIPSHYEPFGLVAIEAMACGTPVVASAVGGLKFSVVSEETGLLVPPQNVSAFATAIRRILSNKSWAHQLSRQAANRVQSNFSWMGVATQLNDLYRQLLAPSLSQPSGASEPIKSVREAIASVESKQQASAKSLTKVS